MRRLAVLLSVVVVAGAGPSVVSAQGGEAVARTFAAPFDTVWDVTLTTLKNLGWEIDTDDKTKGTIVTDDEKVDFKDFGVYGEGSRHKLRVTLKPVTDARTMVTVSRELFTEKRYLWESSFTVKGGGFLYISAQNEGTAGSVTCEILLDGVSRTNATSSGAYVIAECSSAAGRN